MRASPLIRLSGASTRLSIYTNVPDAPKLSRDEITPNFISTISESRK